MKRSIALLPVLLLLQLTVAAQGRYDSTNFAAIDSFVLTIKYEDNYLKLASDLTAPYTDDLSKTRAIFKWITNNISYDYRFINKGKEIKKPDCEDKIDCINTIREWENDYLKKILKTRRAICDGYSKLFKKLCDLNYIQCEIIPGYARTKPYQVGNSMPINHSWNAVLIDTSWYYVDATWAAGYCVEDEETGVLLKFVKEYKDYYWLQKFDRFSRNHYPQSGKWVEKTNLTKEQFFNKPHYFSVEVLENITETSPATGVIKIKKGDSIHFKFSYTRDIKLLQVNSNIFRNPSLWTKINIGRKKTKMVRDTWAEKKQVYIPFKREGSMYEFDYFVKDNSLYYLELVFDYKPAIRYRVRVEN